MRETFTIVSTGAPLVEVSGDGPFVDLRDGLAVPDGVPTIGQVDLVDGFYRFWRVDARDVQAKVAITDSPFGALLDVRRRVERAASNGVSHRETETATERVGDLVELGQRLWNTLVRDAVHLLFQIAPLLFASVVSDLLDEAIEESPWRDMITKSADPVTVNGGDIVVALFLVP